MLDIVCLERKLKYQICICLTNCRYAFHLQVTLLTEDFIITHLLILTKYYPDKNLSLEKLDEKKVYNSRI